MPLDLGLLPCSVGGQHKMSYLTGVCNKCGGTDLQLMQEQWDAILAVLKQGRLEQLWTTAGPILAAWAPPEAVPQG